MQKTYWKFICMDSILTLQHPVRIKTGFSNQSQFWIQVEFQQSHITVVHVLWGGTFRFLFLISTSRYVFFNKGHLGLHISDSYTPNCVIQALAPVIHYRYSLDKYSIVLKLVNFNISYLRSHFALFQPFYVL